MSLDNYPEFKYVPLFAVKPTKPVKLRKQFLIYASDLLGGAEFTCENSIFSYYCLLSRLVTLDSQPFAYHCGQYWEKLDSPKGAPVLDECVFELNDLDGLGRYLASPRFSFDVDEFDVLQFERKEMTASEMVEVLYEWYKK